MTRFVKVKRKVFENVMNGMSDLVINVEAGVVNRHDVVILMEMRKGVHTGRKWGKRVSSAKILEFDNNMKGYVFAIKLESLNWI